MLQINLTVNTIELVDPGLGDAAISQFFKILNENLQISVCLGGEEIFSKDYVDCKNQINLKKDDSVIGDWTEEFVEGAIGKAERLESGMMAESNQWNDVTTFELEKLTIFARQFPGDPLDLKPQQSFVWLYDGLTYDSCDPDIQDDMNF